MYPGPRRPPAELVTIETNGTVVQAVDGDRPRHGVRFEVLPGFHQVAINLDDAEAGEHRFTRRAIAVCFRGQAGHTYLARPTYSGPTWRPEILDETTASVVPSHLITTANATCTAASFEAPAPAAPAVAEGAAPAVAPPAVAPAPPVAPSAPASAPAAPAVEAQVDAEGPAATKASDDEPELPRPTFDLEVETGVAQGGTGIALATYQSGATDTLGAGDGLSLAVGGRWTPLRAGRRLSFGVGGSVGVKYWGIGGGNATLSSFPMTASAHLLVAIDPLWWFVARAGIAKDFDVEFASPDVPHATLQSTVGPFAELGGGYLFGDFAGLEVGLRATSLQYSVGTATLSARSVGVFGSLHFLFGM
jgi:hypothetical protein